MFILLRFRNKMLKITVIIALVAFTVAVEKVNYDNYRVFRIIPGTDKQLNLLKQLKQVEDGYEFWSGPTTVNKPADLLVSPNKLAEITEFLKSNRIAFNTKIKDVQQVISRENPLKTRDSPEDFDLERYHTLEEIYSWLDYLGKKYPKIVEIVEVGKTYEHRVIKGVKLSFGSNKSSVFIESGMHPREWIAPAVALYIIDALLTSTNSSVRQLAENYDWYIVPTVNPDGYAFTHDIDRLWRKSRSHNDNGCFGTDLAINWDYHWMMGAVSENPCSSMYPGTKPFSEIETLTLSNYLKSISDNMVTYLSFHSYGQYLLYPYSYTYKAPANVADLKSIGAKTNGAISRRYQRSYFCMQMASTFINPKIGGTSIDYVKDVLKVPLAYEYKFRGSDEDFFVLPADQIIPNSEEVLDSLIAMFTEVKRLGYPKKSSNESNEKQVEILDTVLWDNYCA